MIGVYIFIKVHLKAMFFHALPKGGHEFINPAIIEFDNFNLYQDQIPLLGGVRGGFMKKA